MGIEIPEALQWAAKYVVGAGDWPEGDETAMRRMADAYTSAATTLDDLGDDAQRQVNQLLAALDGQSADAIEAFWKKLGNDDGALSALTGLLKDQADVVDDGANDIEHTKLMIIAQLVIFAVEMAAALAAMATGVGAPAGAAAGAAARVATQITIRMLMKQLLQRIVTRVVKEAALGALEEGGLDLGIRLIQAAKGDRELSRDDFTAVWQSAAGGAIGGAISGGLGREGGLTNGVGDAAGEGLGNAVGNRAKQFATDYTTEVASDIGSQAAMAAITGEEFELSADTFTSAAAGAAQNQFDRGGDDSGDTGAGNDAENGPDNDPESGNDDSGRGDNDGDRSSNDGDRGGNQNQANNAGNDGDRGGDNPSNQPNQTSPANANSNDSGNNNETPARTQPASTDTPTSSGNDGPRTTDNPNSNNDRGGENTPSNNDTGNQPNNTNPANASSNDDSGNANANNNEPPARTQTDGDPTNSGNNPTGTGENPPTNRVAANEPEAAPANAENNDSGNEPPARTQPDGDQTNTAANNNPAQTSPGSDSNTPNSTGNPDAGGDHPPSQQPSPTSNDSSGDHGSGATNPPADQPRSTTDEPGNTASGNDKSPTAQPTQTAPTAPATQQSRPGDQTQDAPVGSLDLPAQGSPTTSPQQSPSPLDLPAQDPTPTQDPGPLDLPPQDTPPAQPPRPLDLPPQEASPEQPPSPLDLPDPNTQGDTEPQSSTGAPLTTAPSNTTTAAATATAPPLDAGTQPNSPAASAPTSTTPTPPQGPTPTTQPSPTPQPNGPTPARPTPPRSNNAGTQTNSSPTAATTTPPSPDQERDQSPELPIRPGYDPTIHKYVAHFNDGRPIPRDPFFAGEYNPHIGRYQPTEAEFQAERAHLAANPPAPQNTPRTDPGHHSPDVPNQQPADPTRDETLDSSPATTPSPHDTTPTAGAPHVNDTTPTNATPPNTTPANTDLHDFTNLEAHRARTQLPSWWPNPARDQANNSPDPTQSPNPFTPNPHRPTPTFPDARAPESTPPANHPRSESPSAPTRNRPTMATNARPGPTDSGSSRTADPQRVTHTPDPGRTHNQNPNAPGTHPHSSRPNPRDNTPPHTRPPQTPTAQARAAREFYRNRPPIDGRTTPVTTTRNRNSRQQSGYDVRRYNLPSGDRLSVLTVRVNLASSGNVPPQDVRQFMESVERSVDRTFNTEQTLLSGDALLVDVVFTTNPAEAHLQLSIDNNRDNLSAIPPHGNTESVTNQLRHQLGLPTVSAGGHFGLGPDDIRRLSDDIAASNTPTRFGNPSDLRRFGRNELQAVERTEYQTAVQDSLRTNDRFQIGADPRTNPYGQLINDGGTAVPGRRNNCLDCSLSALSSFLGNPQVAAPRWPDRSADGSLDQSVGERSGIERAQRWLGSPLVGYGGLPRDAQFEAIHNWMSQLGPGSCALVVNSWHSWDSANQRFRYHPDGSPVVEGGHATVIVYPPGASGPLWWDPQAGTVSEMPPPGMVRSSVDVSFIPIPADQGAMNAGTVPNQGTSGTVSGADSRSQPEVPNRADRVRVAVQPATESGNNVQPNHRDDQPGGQRRDGGGNPVPELAGTDDRRGLRRSDADWSATRGRPDLPAANTDQHPAHERNPRPDRVPSDGTGRAAAAAHVPAGDQQTNTGVPADRDDAGNRDVMGGLAQEPGRDLAGIGDDRVLTTTTPDISDGASDTPLYHLDQIGSDLEPPEMTPERAQALEEVLADCERDGVEVRSNDEAQEYLDYCARVSGMDPESIHAVTLGSDLIMVRPEHATNVRILREEWIHTRQAAAGSVSSASVVANEIEAREMILANRHQWAITDEEVDEILREIAHMRETGSY
ncbi:toxin glutamine deamidase domain-containing protein [Nocardia cyriacigeorgica]|uniref:toxin glutamine deamidase domain-containing protein n=1 Tax=Nocardia cyriacigeorgica TaxID=135487 RepID=UPI0009DA8935|nr:toxin glutamine deamidase domain-containing protein [Nocardia cyriacigeorgica]